MGTKEKGEKRDVYGTKERGETVIGGKEKGWELSMART